MWGVRSAYLSSWFGMSVLVGGFLFVIAIGAGPTQANSPTDDGLIAYTSDVEVRPSIWTIHPDGTDPTNLTSSAGIDAFVPAWSPDGYRIAFATNGDIWVMEVDGSDLTNITNTPDENEGHIEWSPDGSRLAYWDDQGKRLQTIGADGTDAITLPTSGNEHRRPRWSPDGSRIAYAFQTGFATYDIGVVDADGENNSALTSSNGAATNTEPDWSPDGSQIAFYSTRSGVSGVWVMDADGANPVDLFLATAPPDTQTMTPMWSPDGSQIAFTAEEDVWVMDSDGGDARNLTNTPDLAERQPVWSLTGSKLAFDSNPGTWDIWIINADGSGLFNLTDTPDAQEWLPVWQPPSPPVGLVEPTAGLWRMRDSGGRSATFYYGIPGDLPFVGDWNCDGVDTPGLYRQSDGYVYLRNSNDFGIADASYFFGTRGDIPFAGDWDGDSCDTVSIYRPSEGKVYVINTLGTGFADYSYYFGVPGDRPFAGDFDNDGTDTVGLYRQSSGFAYLTNSTPGNNEVAPTDNSFFYGNPGDRILAGDWDGDGDDSVGIYRPANHAFYLSLENQQGNADSQFTWTNAGSNWMPIAGNFDLK